MKAAWAIQGIGFLCIIAAVLYLSSQSNEPTPQAPMHDSMLIRSPAWNHEERIPAKYSCSGEDTSPPVAIDAAPRGTQSFVLIMDDPDAPGGTWDHWIVFNIPKDTTRIGEGDTPPGVSGTNSWGRLGYGGPCPPPGSEHRYLMKVFALDTILDLPEGASKTDIEKAMEGHVLERSTLMGRFSR